MKAFTLALIVVVALSHPVHGYLHFTTSAASQAAVLKWRQTPVRWFALDRGAPGITASEFQATMARAFSTWQAVPTASIAFEFGGFSGSVPFEDDGVSVLGFQSEPGMERVLGATGFLIDTVTGDIVESDIFFNATLPWSTAQGGDPARYDLESVAVHEIGHFLGLGHSALGETESRADGGRRVLATGAVMFPVSLGMGITRDRELQPDDIAGVSELYPDGGFRSGTGTVRGKVTRNGSGVLGAHVIAFHQETGRLIAGFSLNRDGEFQIAGLPPGPLVIRVEPLDDADVDSFFSRRDSVDTAFQVTFHDRLIVAPAGGAGDRFTIVVRQK